MTWQRGMIATLENKPYPAVGPRYVAWWRAMKRQSQPDGCKMRRSFPRIGKREELLAKLMQIKNRMLRIAVGNIIMFDRTDIKWGKAFDGYRENWTEYKDHAAIAAELVKFGYAPDFAAIRANLKQNGDK